MIKEQLEILISNEREYRKMLVVSVNELKEDVKKIREEQYAQALITNTLKVKFGFVSLLFGVIGGSIIPLLALILK